MKKKTPNFNTFSLIVAVIAVVLVVKGIYTAGDVIFGSMKEPSVTVHIQEGDSAADIAHMLKEKHVIKNEHLFLLFSKLKKADLRYHEGDFEIKKGVGYSSIINGLVYISDYKAANIVIPEGATMKEITDIAAGSGLIEREEFEKALRKKYDYDFLEGIERGNYLEGYLFPDTYNISNRMSAEDVVDMMLERFGQVYTEKYKKRAKQIGYTDDEIIILASIIEAEAGSDEDRAKVSGVFHNRLSSKTYPYLESCATVQYILGERKKVLSVSDTKIDSPYNTYLYKGLPVGPICSPGKASIEAALYPEEGGYYFFVSDSSGKIYYSKTFEQHEKKRKELQQ